MKGYGLFVLLFYPEALSKAIPNSPVQVAPTFFTALGILGTFASIFFALQSVSLDNTDPEILVRESTRLLGGMKTAFSTSLVELLVAIPSMVYLSWSKTGRQKYRNQVRRDLGEIAVLETPNHFLSRLDSRENVFDEKILGEALAKALVSVVQELKQEGIPAFLKACLICCTHFSLPCF